MVRRADTVAFLKKGDRLPSRYCLIATFDTVTWAIKSVNLVTGIAGTPAFASDPCLNITTSKGILSNQGAHPTFTARGHDLDSPSTNIHSHRWQQLAGASYYWEMNNSLPSQPDSATVEIAFITHTPLSVQRPSHTTPQIALYPNPVNSVLHCLFSPGEPPIALMLTDLLGRVVRARTPAIGNGALEIDCSDLPAGSYLLRGIGLGQIVVVQHQ